MIFCSQARVKMKTTHPNATFAESGRILGNMWSTLDAASKEVYVKAANEHKSAWLAQSKLLSEQQQLQKDEEERQQQEQQSSIKVKLPKQPPSPFTIFSQQVRDQVRTKHPDASFGDLGRILEAMWSSLNKRDKEVGQAANYLHAVKMRCFPRSYHTTPYHTTSYHTVMSYHVILRHAMLRLLYETEY